MPTYDFVTADPDFISGTASFNSSRDAVGFAFTNTSGADVIVTQLGRWVLAGNSQTHLLGIYTTTSFSSPAASVTIDCNGATANAFVYGSISPYTIAAGATVYFLSTENSGGDYWWGGFTGYPSLTTVGIGATSSAAANFGSINSFGNGNSPTGYSSWGPMTFRFTAPTVPGWTKAGNTYTSLGYPYAIGGCVADAASAGDIIELIPSGYIWGLAGGYISLYKTLTLDGKGSTISISSSAQQYSNPGTLSIEQTGVVVKNFTFRQPEYANRTTAMRASARNWRVTQCNYDDSYTGQVGYGDVGYFIYASEYGLMDNCNLNPAYGQDEYLVTRGPSTSVWYTGKSLGNANAVYMEDCRISGIGYNDFNSNGQGVIRYCTFVGSNKIDSHGYSTNASPKYGVRQTEAYRNRWTQNGGNTQSVEIRGGIFYGFENSTVSSQGGFQLTDYGFQSPFTNWGIYQTPKNYPLAFQIGAGPLKVIDATGLIPYQWAMIRTVGTTDYTAIGAASNSTGDQFNPVQFTATAPGTGNGTVWVTNGAAEPSYIWGNTQTGAGWGIWNGNVPAEAIAVYTGQTQSGSATFTASDIIKSNRDYYADKNAGVANIGVVTGSASDMASATPTAKYGFWCANTGSWNTTTGANMYGQGQFYTGNGSQWVLDYVPYTYPHPLRGTGSGPVPPPDITYILKRLGHRLKFKGYAPA